MTYTTQQLQAMSDFEVNKALCIKLGHDVSGISEQRNMMTDAVTDYCNNPNDIMPLAFERGISIIKDHDVEQYYACNAFDDRNYDFAYRQYAYFDTNPLRAIACLILMMDE